MINGVQEHGVAASIKVTASSINKVDSEDATFIQANDSLHATLKLSNLSRQLSESAERAHSRNSTLSRQQLSDFAREIDRKLEGNHVPEVKARRAQEVPETQDPERLERALQATRFVANNYQSDSRVANPFAGLSREQLTLIVYDESGGYTVNERDAAAGFVRQIEWEWRRRVVPTAALERSQTGGCPDFYRECLAHYRALPAIEQAMHPADYEARTLRFIDEAIQDQQRPEQGQDMLTLVEVLARMDKQLLPQVAGVEALPASDNANTADEIKKSN